MILIQKATSAREIQNRHHADLRGARNEGNGCGGITRSKDRVFSEQTHMQPAAVPAVK